MWPAYPPGASAATLVRVREAEGMAVVKKERGRGGIVRWLTDGIVLWTSVGFNIREGAFQQKYHRGPSSLG